MQAHENFLVFCSHSPLENMPVTYSCPCFNIKLHLATKYNSINIDQLKSENAVTEPLPGWELGLLGGLEGIHAVIYETLILF